MQKLARDFLNFLVVSLAAISLGILLPACSGSDGDDGGGSSPADSASVTTEQAQQSASRNLNDSIATLGGGIGSAADAPAAEAVRKALGIDLSSLGVGDGTTTQQLQEVVNALLNDPNATVTREGNVVTIDPLESAVCQEIIQAAGSTLALDQATCEQLLSHWTIEIVIVDENNSIIRFKFDDNVFLTAEVSPNRVRLSTDLAELKQVLIAFNEVLNPGTDAGLPAVMTGELAATVEVLGTNHGRTTTEVSKPVNIQGTSNGQPVSLALDTGILLQTEVNENDASASFTVAMGSILAKFPVTDQGQNAFPSELSIAGLTANGALINSGNTLQLTGLGIGGSPASFKVNGLEVLGLAFTNSDITVDGTAQTIAFVKAINIDVNLNDASGLLSGTPQTGTVAVDIPQGTVLTVVGTAENPVIKVTAGGPITVFGTGDLAASLNVPLGTCFNSGLTPVACP
ncbi:MAG: hypothetical protein U9R74_01030 [Pseudomonadota bacterium]|nr:hypothetical protein [Pseudomonadota bacterium]